MSLEDDILDAGDAQLWFELWLDATDTIIAVANEHRVESMSLHGHPTHATRYCSCGSRDCETARLLEGWDTPPEPPAAFPVAVHDEGPDGPMPYGPGTVGRMRLAAALYVSFIVMCCVVVILIAVSR